MKWRDLMLICFIFSCFNGMAQSKSWTLEDCIEYAKERNIELRLSELDYESAAIREKSAKHNRWPDLRGSSNFGYNFGRTIDPTSNEFITSSLGFHGLSLNSGVQLFQANRINHSIQQASTNRKVAELNYEQQELDLSLQIANLYLNALLAKENLKVAESQLDNLENQLERTEKLVKSGAQPKAAEYDMRAEVASQQQQLVDAENNFRTSILQLKQALRLEMQTPFEIPEPPSELSISAAEVVKVERVFDRSLETQPSYEASQLSVRAAQLGEKIARAAFYPSISLGLNLNSNYSTQGRVLKGTETQTQKVPASFNGESGTLTFSSSNPIFENSNWADQMNNNLGYGFSLSLNVPIYNNFNLQESYQLAKMDLLRSEKQLQLQEQSIRSEVESAIMEVRAAGKSYEASQSSLEAAKLSFENVEKEYELGRRNSFDFFQSQQRMYSAEVQLLVAKYDYIFRQKIVDYYLGKPITL